MKIGYIRVSTQEQNTIRQEVLLEQLGVEELYIDKASGKNTDRPELKKMIAYVRRGDTVSVESKKEAIDTTTPTGKFMLTVFGAVAELEREYILQRQREGIAIAKQQGKYKGRKPLSPPGFQEMVIRWKRGEITAAEACRRLGMSKATFYRKVK